jgi:manganese/zinc/iron transport system permease protein
MSNFFSIGAAYPLMVPLLGSCVIGGISGVMGSFVFLREQTLIGDAIAHAVFPGIIGAFIVTQSTSPYILMIGGFCAGVIAVFCIYLLHRCTNIKYDAVLGIILSVFFGIGLVLLTMVQKMPLSQQSILNKFLFGSAATQLTSDVVAIVGTAASILVLLIVFWKEFLLCAYDRMYAQTIGYSVIVYELLLYAMLIVMITVGLYTVGVILMSSMLIAPAVAARQWTYSVHTMASLAFVIGASASFGGIYISSSMEHMPAGPCIILVTSSMAIISLLLAGYYKSTTRRAVL